MAEQLLVRAYHVEVGDCIYIRIPDGNDHFHILLDCGSKGRKDLLKDALAHLEAELPPVAGTAKKRLDLLVATHIHEDHIKGFDAEYFKNIQIGHIWLSAVMDPNHPQSQKSANLHELATQKMRQLAASGLALTPELESLIGLYSINNDGALDALRKRLPERNEIQPRYVHAGMTSVDLGVQLQEATIHVLAPEQDIDHFYFGEEADATLNGFAVFNQLIGAGAAPVGGVPAPAEKPANISSSDFRLLQSRMLSNQLAFADLDSSIQNNMSVVLLIEWRNRRLLFVGDAEWDREFKVGNHNGSWNVMWNQRRQQLDRPLDFLKIGHHGSINATPWNKNKDAGYEVNQILAAILPLPLAGNIASAQAIVSTARKNYETIPAADLLVEIGKRVGNTKRYKSTLVANGGNPETLPFFAEYEALMLDEPQPVRTDIELLLTGQDFVEVQIAPGN